jgi:PIN domain nuclease of toxin-antitoxin system
VDWDWVNETFDIGGTFILARGASPEQIMRAFGMNPARARLVAASDVAQALHDPDWLRTEPPEHPWIRVGVAGEWGFALDVSTAGSGGYEEDAVDALAASAEVVLFTHTQTVDDFRYYARGDLVTTFEPGMLDRYGSDPDRFVEQMRQVGLPANIGDDRAADYTIALFRMLTIALGIRVPRDLALGPLLTVQRETALPRPRPRADAPPAPLVSSAHLRPHVRRLLDSGITADAIAAQAPPALSTNAVKILLGEANVWIPVKNAQQILAMADAAPAPLVSSAQLRPHVRRLLDSGITADAIAAQAGPALSANAVNVLLGEANFWVPGTIAEQVLAVEVPPNA